jgi:glutaredoxin 3
MTFSILSNKSSKILAREAGRGHVHVDKLLGNFMSQMLEQRSCPTNTTISLTTTSTTRFFSSSAGTSQSPAVLTTTTLSSRSSSSFRRHFSSTTSTAADTGDNDDEDDSTVSLSSDENDIEQLITSHKVVLFNKTYCPFCKQAKNLFENQLQQRDASTTTAAVIINLDTLPNGHEIQNTLKSMFGQSTVPYVFVNGTLIGGNSDAQKLARSGKLQQILDEGRK